MPPKSKDGRLVVAENRRARHEYKIGDTFEAGLELKGTEVKSLRNGQANIAEGYVSVESDGLYLINALIPEYAGAGHFFQHEPRRKRRLLLNKNEIHKLALATERKGMTLLALSLYFNPRGKAKLKIAIGEGKKLHDKRESQKKHDWNPRKSTYFTGSGLISGRHLLFATTPKVRAPSQILSETSLVLIGQYWCCSVSNDSYR